MSHPVPRSPLATEAELPRTRRARGPYLQAIRDAWDGAVHTPRSLDRLDVALHAFARDGRARGLTVGALLRELDALARPDGDGGARPGFAGVREWAGTQVIRAYYRGD